MVGFPQNMVQKSYTWLYQTALCYQQGSANGFFMALFMDSHQLLECSCLEICLILGHSALSVSDPSRAEYANQDMSKRVKISDHFLFNDNANLFIFPWGLKIRFRQPKTRTGIFQLINQTHIKWGVWPVMCYSEQLK